MAGDVSIGNAASIKGWQNNGLGLIWQRLDQAQACYLNTQYRSKKSGFYDILTSKFYFSKIRL